MTSFNFIKGPNTMWVPFYSKGTAVNQYGERVVTDALLGSAMCTCVYMGMKKRRFEGGYANVEMYQVHLMNGKVDTSPDNLQVTIRGSAYIVDGRQYGFNVTDGMFLEAIRKIG